MALELPELSARVDELDPDGQKVRRIDVWLLGPFMMLQALNLRGLARPIMLGAGFLTIWYNRRNFLRVRDRQ